MPRHYRINSRYEFVPRATAMFFTSPASFDLLLQLVEQRCAEEFPERHVQPVAQLLVTLIVSSLRRPSGML